jgi:hypothetical protein
MTSIHLDDILRFRMREPLGTGGSHIRNPKFFFGLCIYFLTMYRRNLSIFFSFLELWLLKKEIKIILALKKERKNLWERSGKTWSMCQAASKHDSTFNALSNLQRTGIARNCNRNHPTPPGKDIVLRFIIIELL